MLPTFFVIGAAKCGTTSLSTYLGRHPEIHMSSIKEPRYFAVPDEGRPFAGVRVGDRAAYEALFESDKAIRGEASPSYSQHPWRTGVPERISLAVPNARFIYVVGDPLRRIASHHAQAVAHGGERRSLGQVLGDDLSLDHPYICTGLYARQLDRYRAVFPAQQIHVVDQETLMRSRRVALAGVFAFLGASRDYWDVAYDATHNRTTEHRSVSTGPYSYLRNSAFRPALRRLPEPLRDTLVSSARRVMTRPVEKRPIAPILLQRLESIYRPDTERLRTLTGQPFDCWSV